MKRNIQKAISVVLMLSGANTLTAGSGHSHTHGDGHSHSHAHSKTESDKVNIKNTAQFQVKRYVINKKLDRSWYNLKPKSMEKKKINSKDEWVVTFYNVTEKNSEKQTLYIFIDVYGEFTGANFTGV